MKQLPERFTTGEKSAAFKSYIFKRYDKYGFSRSCYGQIQYSTESPMDYCPRERYRYVENPADGLRFVGKAHDVAEKNGCFRTITHRGWFIDNDQDQTVCGEVYQLPARDGECYVSAVSDPHSDGATIDFHSMTGYLMEAVIESDRMAERYAEAEREYQAKYAAEQRIEEIKSEISEAYKGFKTLSHEIRANCDKLAGMTALHKLLQAEWKRVKRHILALRKEREKIEDDPWSAC